MNDFKAKDIEKSYNRIKEELSGSINDYLTLQIFYCQQKVNRNDIYSTYESAKMDKLKHMQDLINGVLKKC